MTSIYRKTAKGQAEIETRANKLSPRLRTALIMVDGRRSELDLRPLLQPTPEETLATLLHQGFIEIVGTAAGAAATAPVQPPGPAPVSAPASPPLPGPATPMRPMPVPLPTLQREAVRLLTDLVGPMAEPLAMRIERARSTDELRTAVAMAAQVIANTRGRQAAETYAARFADV